MVFLELFWSFCKIGFTSFGGLSMVPLISQEMVSHGWMTVAEVSDIVAIAEITPGPLGLNCATFAGTQAAGFLGAVCANLGILSPTLVLCAVVAVFFEKFRDAAFMRRIMTGVRPVCLGLILGVLCSLALTNFALPGGGVNLPALAIGAAAAVALLGFRLSIPMTLLLSAAMGLVLIR